VDGVWGSPGQKQGVLRHTVSDNTLKQHWKNYFLCKIFHTCFVWHDKKFTNLCDGQLFRILIESVLVKLIKFSPPLQE
jgi:hypothetical protein